MNYRYNIYLVCLFFSCQLWPVTEQQSSSPSKKEKLKSIPTIPELSTNIKNPARWKNGTRLIFFYSPWCKHSNSLRPLLYDLIEELYDRNISGIWVGQIDVSVNSEVARTFRIKNTPTLILFQNGTRYEFDDDHTVKNLVKFITSVIMSPSLTEIHSYSQLKELQVHHPVLFMLVYDEEIDHDWEVVYKQVSKERILVGKFLYTINTTIPQQLGLTLPSLPRLLALKDDQAYQYKDTLTKYRMTLWVENEQFPALPFRNRTTFRPIVAIANSKRLCILFVSSIDAIPLNQRKALEAVRRVAESRKLHSGYQFVVLDDKELVNQMTGTDFVFPSFFVWEKRTGVYYLYDQSVEGGFSEKAISTFLFSVTSGKAKESGGPSIANIFSYYYWMAYNLIQAMISHRPVLSSFSLVCLAVGLTVCLYTRIRSKKNQEFQRRLNIRRAVRSKKRQQQLQEERLRRRLHEVEEEEEEEDSESGENSQDDKELETDKTK